MVFFTVRGIQISERLNNDDLPSGYLIAAEDACICKEYVVIPLSQEHSSPGSASDPFNFYQSSSRMHIEQALGILIA